MTALDIPALRALVAAASPLPWDGKPPDDWGSLSGYQIQKNNEFIIAAVNALPELLDSLDQAEQDADHWHARYERLEPVVAAACKWADIDFGEPGEMDAQIELNDAVRELRRAEGLTPSDGDASKSIQNRRETALGAKNDKSHVGAEL